MKMLPHCGPVECLAKPEKPRIPRLFFNSACAQSGKRNHQRRSRGQRFQRSLHQHDHNVPAARVIVGDWEQGLLACDFGVLDILVNSISFDVDGKVQIVLHQYFDVQILDESVFSIYREEV